MGTQELSCSPTNWWSAAALGGLMNAGVGGYVRPDERALK